MFSEITRGRFLRLQGPVLEHAALMSLNTASGSNEEKPEMSEDRSSLNGADRISVDPTLQDLFTRSQVKLPTLMSHSMPSSFIQ